MNIPTKIILMGPGRSGTTFLSHLFDHHPRVYSINKYIALYPKFVLGSSLHRMEHVLPGKLHPSGSEAYRFWHYYLGKFDDKTEIDQARIEHLKKVLNRMKQYSGREIFVTKITGESRKHILDELFGINEYLVLNIERHPIKDVASMCKQRWLYKREPEKFLALSVDKRTQKYIDFYKQGFRSRHGRYKESSRFLSIKLEDLLQQPDDVFGVIESFTGLRLRMHPQSSEKRNKGNHYKPGENLFLDYVLIQQELREEIKYLGY